MQEIEARSGGIWRPSPGSVYPALQQLEDEGLIRAEEHEGGKRFTLTDDGGRFVAEHEKELEAPWNAVREDVSEDELNLREVMRQLAPAVYQVAQVGNPDQIAEAKRLLAETRRGLYRILAVGDGE
jgi:DNA-binding PadR family transcriptional regulator